VVGLEADSVEAGDRADLVCSWKMGLTFKKDLPGADIVFQPDDMEDYKNDAWDIRISIGDAPLEEAFYFTVDDPNAVNLTIDELLDSYALNPEFSSKLDTEEYPDLPFMQEELIQYRTNEHKGLLKLEYYVNHSSFEGPVNLWEPAKQYLCVCTYHDGSYDYRVLDLVIVPDISETTVFEIEQRRSVYGHIYLLMLLGYFMEKGERAFRRFAKETPMAAFLGRKSDLSHNVFANGMRRLETDHFISTSASNMSAGFTLEGSSLEFTQRGTEELASLKEESQSLAYKYDKYDSVSVSPVALGIPDGFDVRVQMMEFDGLDCERSVLLRVLDEGREEYFGQGDWCEIYESFSFFEIVKEALAYKTNFSVEILQALKELAEHES
jgi:hypothetical protein